MKKKVIFIIVILMIPILSGCFSTQKMWNRYENNLTYPRISENDFDISEYRPFIENSKVAKLDTVSTLKLKNGNYPLVEYLYAVTLSDNSKPNVEKMLEWIRSEQGHLLIKKTGYCPIK